MTDHEDLFQNLDLAGSLTPQSVRQCRLEVESFFTREWDELRSMIRRMEEEHWLPTADESTPRPDQASRSEGTGKREGLPASPPEAPFASEFPPVQETRLTALARELEKKLHHAQPLN